VIYYNDALYCSFLNRRSFAAIAQLAAAAALVAVVKIRRVWWWIHDVWIRTMQCNTFQVGRPRPNTLFTV